MLMKFRVFAHFQLVILVVYIFRPVFPFIEYAINKDFIIKNLCINRDKPLSCCEGKCHLAKQLKKSNDNNNDPKDKNTNKRIRNEETKEFLSIPVTIPIIFETGLVLQPFPATIVSTIYSAAIFVPPKLRFTI